MVCVKDGGICLSSFCETEWNKKASAESLTVGHAQKINEV